MADRVVAAEEGAAPVGAASGQPPRSRRGLRTTGLVILVAGLLGVLEVWGNIGYGYTAGWGDHFVLSPQGLRWVHPEAFENDWFLAAAPQPHWFFDALTALSERSGLLSAAYALFWMAGLVAFAAATVLLAGRFAPGARWQVAVGVTLVAAVTPWMIGGTGSPVIAVAIPAVLSANLIYLLIAAFLTQRLVVVAVLAPLIAIVHVQQGSIAIVLVASMLTVDAVRRRRIDVRLAAALGLTIGFVVLGLSLRPVAANLGDFVEICDRIIPYHCAAHLWPIWDVMATVGLVVLCALSALLMRRPERWRWFATAGLAALGYTGGFLSDALRIPVLGEIAQGVNVYRLAAVLLPFAVWGAFVPLLVRLPARRMIVLIAIWGAAWVLLLATPSWAGTLLRREVLLTTSLLLPLIWHLWRTWRRGRARGAGSPGGPALLAGVLVVASVASYGGLSVRGVDFTFVRDAGLREWGSHVREIVPAGEVLVASPRSEWVKLVTQRAVIADCKNVPYGGPAWDEWQRRLDALAGWEQCVAPGPLLYDALPADALADVADEYGSEFIVVNRGQDAQIAGLKRLGWAEVLAPVGGSGAHVLHRE
ncbi:DUF6798 domain-containing protein [Microbacterium atlanticum]|uniref:DUF6798 domain-containing protein n=1 Tax=Microbacterium atlanticum TaxID=2782168 RepID=UPI0018895437|nr:DUF6798 domain-containing protein [Microbacterium atlanticum]